MGCLVASVGSGRMCYATPRQRVTWGGLLLIPVGGQVTPLPNTLVLELRGLLCRITLQSVPPGLPDRPAADVVACVEP
jgi:hypothetical protein